VRILRPAPYTALVFVLSALVAAPLVVQRYGWSAVAEEWHASWPRIAAVGFLSGVAYSLVLAAYTLAPVAYAGAVREVSVVLAALAGWLFLGEGFGARRTAGAVLVMAGIAALAVYAR
jgi:drug/metabolite transporter (DMT)-like permease